MANRKFSSKIVQRFDVNFATTPITQSSYISIGLLPKNSLVTDGYMVVKTELGDADDGDDTTLSIGVTSAATALYAATSIAGMNANTIWKLEPGVLNIGSGQAITTVDTPAEVVAKGRTITGLEMTSLDMTDNKWVILTAGAGQNINAGTVSIFIEYLKYA